MYILLLSIIFILILCYYSKNNIEHFTENIKINFIKRKNAIKIYKKEYFNQYKFNELELNAKTNFKLENNLSFDQKLSKMKKIFKNSLINFSKEEKNYITKNINNLIQNVNKFNKKYKNNIKIPSEWNLIKLGNNLDWSLPYTIGKYIVVPSNMSDNITESTLLHESMHILQRYNKKLFNKFYINIFNFKKIKKLNNGILKKKIITNPDAHLYEWALYYKNEYFVPILLINEKNGKHFPTTVILDKNLKIKKDKNNRIITKNDNINIMENMFYGIKQNYHPNEIFACLISDIIKEKEINIDNKMNDINNLFKNITI